MVSAVEGVIGVEKNVENSPSLAAEGGLYPSFESMGSGQLVSTSSEIQEGLLLVSCHSLVRQANLSLKHHFEAPSFTTMLTGALNVVQAV